MKQQIIIRSENSADYAAINQLNKLAFQQTNEVILVDKIRQSNNYIPNLSLVAELNQSIVGYAMFSYIDLVGRETSKVLALAPVAVLPEYQHQGIGSLLIQTGLEKAKKISPSIVIVLGSPKFYHRFGLKTAIDYGIQSPFNVPDEYFMVQFLSEVKDNYQGKVFYPAAFDDV